MEIFLKSWILDDLQLMMYSLGDKAKSLNSRENKIIKFRISKETPFASIIRTDYKLSFVIFYMQIFQELK